MMDQIEYGILELVNDYGELNNDNIGMFYRFDVPYYSITHLKNIEEFLDTKTYLGKSNYGWHIISCGGWVMGRTTQSKEISVDTFYKLLMEEVLKEPDLLSHLPYSYFDKNEDFCKVLMTKAQKLNEKDKLKIEKYVSQINNRIKRDKKAERKIERKLKIKKFFKRFRGIFNKKEQTKDKDEGKGL